MNQPAQSSQALYDELNDDLVAIGEPLLDLAEKFLREQDNFLPFGAELSHSDLFGLVAATSNSEDSFESSTDVLPLLLTALRSRSRSETKAVALVENVAIGREGEQLSPAIKVSVEHSRGLVVAMYLPFSCSSAGDYSFGSLFWLEASPQVGLWSKSDA
jgi:hypothetical protein